MMSARGRRRVLRLNVDADRLMGTGPKNYSLHLGRGRVRTEPEGRIEHGFFAGHVGIPDCYAGLKSPGLCPRNVFSVGLK